MTSKSSKVSSIEAKELISAGAHLGHLTRYWNPKMKPFIYGTNGNLHIINLASTIDQIDEAGKFLARLGAHHKSIMWVSTKPHLSALIRKLALETNATYVTNAWISGTLTNSHTILKGVSRLKDLEEKTSKTKEELGLSKKDYGKLLNEKLKLEKNLSGIINIDELPSALIVVGTTREVIALNEARAMGIKTIGIVDTNCDPDMVDFPIAANDDAIHAVDLILTRLADYYTSGSKSNVKTLS